ncbi:DUF5067 domain-containing protein [Holzapfeliella sp. He02]|uniref:DUF5067 domain-containing protein n=1 Tax=Holzapfeliella saturejae TaxID=3082953 RepID=A0ABU8SHK5_9LACO
MKKLLSAGLLLSTLALAGCSSTLSNNNSSQGNSSATSSQTYTNTSSFKNNVFENNDAKIEIVKTQVSQPGGEVNELGGKPAFVIWYKITNKSGAELTPGSWLNYFDAYQSDSGTESKLTNPPMPQYTNYTRNMVNSIKKGETAENAVAYELTNTTQPVRLVAQSALSQEKFGEQTFNLK